MLARNADMAGTDAVSMAESTTLMENEGDRSDPRLAGGDFRIAARIDGEGYSTRRPTRLQEAHESVWRDPTRGLPSPLLEMFRVGPCRCEFQQFAVCQVHVTPEKEVYATEVSEGHARPQVVSGKYRRFRSRNGSAESGPTHDIRV
jgi:hypothetical protein